MTTSPRLPADLVRRAAGASAEVTEAELDRVTELALRRDARPPGGWAQMTRRLLWSTPWEPGRTIAFAALGTELAVGLAGAGNLPGLTGATARGGTWAVRDGQLIRPRRERPGRACAAGLT